MERFLALMQKHQSSLKGKSPSMANKNAKSLLIRNVIFRLSLSGSFQHNNIYNKKISSKENKEFKQFLRSRLEEYFILILENQNYTHSNHCATIIKFSKAVSKKYGYNLKDHRLNIGTSQKIINLYWKALWIFDLTKQSPIHCPFDGIIIKKLTGEARNIKWTKMTTINEYKLLVKCAQKLSKSQSLAEWELTLYNSLNFGEL